MNFRYDINGLRAIAVIAVVFFHFKPSLIPGGFAGVDVFFVISGFLMTRIVFLKFETFNLLDFYTARINRIIPALVGVCITLIFIGWFILTPYDYQILAKHISASVGFFSNVLYWRESGYFDSASNSKWLLHTWSLSVEWQFYIIYPLILLALRKFLNINNIRRVFVLGTALSFFLGVYATYKWPDPSYFLLPTRAWEMMFGGLAYLYPLRVLNNKKSELVGLFLILTSYGFITSDIPWPGYMAILPVFGTYIIIQSNRQNSVFTNNVIFQVIGKWSYSIYLWHWPIFVLMSYFEILNWWVIGICVSIIMGGGSYRFIESIRFQPSNGLIYNKPLQMCALTLIICVYIFGTNGAEERLDQKYNDMFESAIPSPLREKCHISEYKAPMDSCEYFGKNIEWAVFGDSHTVELAYALAERLRNEGVGVKHLSFSGCTPLLKKCSKWYEDSLDYLIKNDEIQNVVINHRYSQALFGDNTKDYPYVAKQELTEHVSDTIESIDSAIFKLAKVKKNVYVFLPIPELGQTVQSLIAKKMLKKEDFDFVEGTSVDYYNERNSLIIKHFNSVDFPNNVVFIHASDAFCKHDFCYAVKDSNALYYDNNHPSLYGARLLVDLIEFN